MGMNLRQYEAGTAAVICSHVEAEAKINQWKAELRVKEKPYPYDAF